MDIGARLKIARDAAGYTLEKASQESGVGQSSISEFENSRREPRFSQLNRLAKVYRKTVEFFLTDEPIAKDVMLWRDKPSTGEERKIEAEFRQLCEQFRRLEVLSDDVRETKLPQQTLSREEFGYPQAARLADWFRREFLLGGIPSASLKQILEEKFYVKIFYLPFCGSAISTFSENFGAAILLNKDSKLWRRNFDLAHELFHLLTWHIFRVEQLEHGVPSENEEKLASAFASRLLLPTDTVKDRIESVMSNEHQVSFEALDEIAREFGVSLEALLWRTLYLYNKSVEEIEGYIGQVKKVRTRRPPRRSDEPDELPERYCSLAIRALREGRLSLMRFAEYMRISYRKAGDYLTDDEDFTDEEISISVA
ncbi:MAG: helix-turn-helix domain-containing protein [Planctomycetota bacterium]|jgi:Zn-dependent peptidase ImmA (M78 family)/DNA-binding XRE family transcriptional regulator